MRLNLEERHAFRRRFWGTYARAIQEQPMVIVSYLLGHVAIVARNQPLSVRYEIAERARDLADLVERGNG
jgi:hypothetical protein